MRALSEYVARMKAWQLFLLIVVPIVAMHTFIMSHFFTNDSGTVMFEAEEFQQFMSRSLMLTAWMMLAIVGWMGSLMHASNIRIRKDIRPSIRLATVGGLIAVLYAFVGIYLWPKFFRTPPEELIGPWLPVFIVTHTLATFGMFFLLWTAAKNLVMAEEQRTVTFSNVSVVLFLFWFSPIGLWFLQPRVNRLVQTVPLDDQQHEP